MHENWVGHRHSAFVAQSGRCFYCGFPMWEKNIEFFARANNLKPTQARRLKCTAEHLEARGVGGTNKATNIVAACLCCNLGRHRRKKAPSPGAYRQFVQQRLNRGRWHDMSLITRFRRN